MSTILTYNTGTLPYFIIITMHIYNTSTVPYYIVSTIITYYTSTVPYYIVSTILASTLPPKLCETIYIGKFTSVMHAICRTNCWG